MIDTEIIRTVLSLGIGLGIILLALVVLTAELLSLEMRISRLKKFLRERKLTQQYEDWKIADRRSRL